MGNLLRRFWIPALLSSELAEPDGPPVRVELLGERLVAFRDTDGRVGLLDTYCAHRRANLFWGRNEACGLRCAYHGWKFDVNGVCVDIPNVSKGDMIRTGVRVTSYPVQERGGVAWAFMGPGAPPPFPATEVFDLPPSHRHIQKIVLEGNWFQFMEGDVDSSHVAFLHSRVDGRPPVPGTFIPHWQFGDLTPKLAAKTTKYGMMLTARREAGPDEYSLRVTQWLMPFTSLIAAVRDSAFTTNIRIPLTDEKTMHLRIFARIDQPLTANDRAILDGGVLFPEMMPGTFETRANIGNDYLIDRAAQKTTSFTGIKSIPVQDYAMVQDQGGPCADRSRENLIESDLAIIAVRRRILRAVKALAAGEEPPEASNAAAYRVRSIDFVAPKDMDILTAVERALPEYGPLQLAD
jgi:phenylpropionate dioxygenase-like ring-hydroxylating dioxygenase large terminal subunit